MWYNKRDYVIVFVSQGNFLTTLRLPRPTHVMIYIIVLYWKVYDKLFLLNPFQKWCPNKETSRAVF